MLTKFDLLKELKTLNGFDKDGKNSLNWFRNAAQLLKINNQVKMDMVTKGPTLVNSLDLGRLYMYLYDPKHKDTLPAWDMFPLVFIINRDSTGFTALNMHYLDPERRLIFFLKLQQFMSDPRMTKNTKLKLTWSLISSASKWPDAAVCIKRYLWTHVKSRFLEIPATDWRNAVMLPLASFQKQQAQTVWKNNRTK